jgi:hypothetical protein
LVLGVAAASALAAPAGAEANRFAAASPIPSLPLNTAPPTIAGTPRDREVLSVNPGSWIGATDSSYAWERCDPEGLGCILNPDAGSSTYTITPADVGSTLRVRETASNAAGSAEATSLPTAVVTSVAPTASAPPTISGAAQAASTLIAQPGTWDGTPAISLAFSWQRCEADGVACEDVPGATESRYTAGLPDVGRTLRVRVTGTNGGGSATAVSAATSPVAAAPLDGVAASPLDSGSTTTPVAVDGASGATATATAAQESTAIGGACARVLAFSRPRARRLKAVPRVTLTVRPATGGRAPLRVTVRAARGRLKSVTYTLDSRRLRRVRRAPFRLAISPTTLRPGRHLLRARVTPRRGRARTLTLGLRTARC